MHNQTLQKWAALSNTVTRHSLSQTLMSNALQYKASKGFRYINLALLRGGVLCNISPCEAHFSPPPAPLGNYCIVPYVGALDSPPEARIMVEKTQARNPAAPALKGLSQLKFSRMRWTISQGMVSHSLNDT